MSHADPLLRLAERIADGEQVDAVVGPVDGPLAGAFAAMKRISQVSQSYRRFANSEPPEPLETGSSWGHLRINQLLGSGGIGRVFLAHDGVLDCHVAVKFLSQRARRFIDEDLFIAEARRMAKVRHPNVLAVFGAATYGGRPGFWCEYLEGQTLQAKLDAQALGFEQVQRYALNLTSALSAVHAAGLVHGDVKALNIILEPNRGAVLMDFGAGVDLREGPQAGLARQATPAIMSPQQLDGEPVSQSCDVYALGLLFYSMDCGRAPFSAQTLRERARRHTGAMRVDLTPLQGPGKWRSLIRAMLSEHAADRPTIFEVHQALTKIQKAPLVRARRVAMCSALALFAGVSIALGYAYIKTRQENAETALALAQSQGYNQLLNEVLSSASPMIKGKQTLMLDVLRSVEKRLQRESHFALDLRTKALNTIAHTYSALDQPEAALALVRSLEGRVTDVDTAFALQVLAARQLRQLNDHQGLAEQVALLDEQVGNPGVQADSRAKYWTMKAVLHRNSGQMEQAQLALTRALESRDEIPKDVLTAALVEQAHVLVSNSQFDAAISELQEALAATRTFCGCEVNLNTLVVQSEIATTHMYAGRSEKGVAELGRVSAIADEFLGPDHAQAIVISMNYAGSLNAIGEYQAVIDVLSERRARLLANPQLASEELDVLENNLANAYLNLEQFDAAEEIYRTLLQRAQDNGAFERHIPLTAVYNLTELYYKSERPRQAYELARKHLETVERVLGKDSLVALELRDATGWSLFLMGEHSAAMSYLKPLLEIKHSLLGEEHPLTQSTRQHLEQVSAALRHPHQAEPNISTL